MKRNKELFYKIADKIEAEPERYDQDTWGAQTACGTAHCVAGWAANLEGCRATGGLGAPSWGLVIPPNGEIQSVRYFAMGALGLTEEEADNLFCATWVPRLGLSVPEALRLLGEGVDLESVSDWDD